MFSWVSNLWGNVVESVKKAAKHSPNVQILKKDGAVNCGVNLVLADASQYHVVVTLPPARNFLGQLSIVCVDPTHGISISPDGTNVIFDSSNGAFHAKGDALTLISDNDTSPGTWYIIGRYAALWYA